MEQNNNNDSLGTRMKQNYENRSRYYLVRRMPVIIRIDGKAFHTFTKGFDKPYDELLINAMHTTMRALCEQVQGCVLGYVQSDEISLLLIDYQALNTDAWFDNNLQKICSVSASIATLEFNKFMANISERYNVFGPIDPEEDPPFEKRRELLNMKQNKALFDSRAFNIPREEVTNYFLWRQQDATRNSIEGLGQAHFSANELHKVTCNQIQDMLMLQKGINWNDQSTVEKRGACCIKVREESGEYKQAGEVAGFVVTSTRSYWEIDTEIPIFSQDRDYIEKLLYPHTDDGIYSKYITQGDK